MTIDMEQSCNNTPEKEHSLDDDNNIDSKVEFSLENSDDTFFNQTNSKPTKSKRSSIWEAEIIHKDVGSVFCKSYLISRHLMNKDKEDFIEISEIPNDKLREKINLSAHLDNQITITGRVKSSIVEEYFQKIRRHSNKEFLVLRLHPTTIESRKTYLKMFEFFHERERCGVIEQKKLGLKDVFIYPLSAKSEIPSFILPLEGNGLEKRRPHILLMFIVRSPLDDTIYTPVSQKLSDKKIIENIDNKSENENQTPIFCMDKEPDPDEKLKQFSTEKILECIGNDNNATLEAKVVALLLSHIRKSDLNSESKDQDQATNLGCSVTPEQNELNIPENEIKTNSKSRTHDSSHKSSDYVKHKQPSMWEGDIIHKEIGSLTCKAFLVSRHQIGKFQEELNFDSFINTDMELLRKEINLSVSLSDKIKINGSTRMIIVHDYLEKIRKHSNKEFLIFRLHPTNLQEGRQSYVELFEFFHRKNRCGVIDEKKPGLKDFFLYPLNAHSKIPSFFLPFERFGFEKRRPHMLLMLVVRYPLEDKIYKSLLPNYSEVTNLSDCPNIELKSHCHMISNPTLPDENKNFPVEIKSNKVQIVEKTPIFEKEDNAVNNDNEILSKPDQKNCDDDDTSPWNLSGDSDLSDTEHLGQPLMNNVDPEQDSEKCCIIDFEPIFNPMKLDDDIIPFLSYPEFDSHTNPVVPETQSISSNDKTSSPHTSVAHKRISSPQNNSPYDSDPCDSKRIKYSDSGAG